MANERVSTSSNRLSTTWVDEFGDTFCFTKPEEAFCNNCGIIVSCKKKSQLSQHIKTQMHQASLNSESGDTFYSDLCEAFIVANIPLHKLQNPVLKGFLAKYTNRHIPDDSTLRKNYIPGCYKKIMRSIQNKVTDNYIWVSADETTDILGRCVTNVLIGILHPTLSYTPYLIRTAITSSINSNKMYEIIVQSLSNSCITIHKENVLLFTSDAAAYMLKTGKLLKECFPNMLHITCLAHALHRICEFVRDQFPDVDKLISLCKKIFLKAPSRVSVYKELNPLLPLPPAPVITRWGTWIEASNFYFNHLNNIKTVVSSLPDDASSIIECKKLLLKTSLQHQLNFIAEHFGTLPQAITYFETQNLSLKDSLSKLDEILNNLKLIPGEFGDCLRQKIKLVFDKNPDLHILYQISSQTFTDVANEQYQKFIPYFDHPPLSSCDVERSFSIFKDILTPKRNRLTEENVEKLVVISVNKTILTGN